MKIAFLDRDGTIIRDYPDAAWSKISQPEFLPGSKEALQNIRNLGYQIIIITNQYLINEGFITQQHYNNFADRFLLELQKESIEILKVYYCPHRRDEGCNCCKPQPGMIANALADFPAIEIENSFVVGDNISDIQLADHFGLRSFGIGLDGSSPLSRRIDSLADVATYV